jgi:hypothetical protein
LAGRVNSLYPQTEENQLCPEGFPNGISLADIALLRDMFAGRQTLLDQTSCPKNPLNYPYPKGRHSVRQGQVLVSLQIGGESAPESINQEQDERKDTTGETRFGTAGGRQVPQHDRPPSLVRSCAILLEYAVGYLVRARWRL